MVAASNVLIAGASGVIGSAAVAEFLREPGVRVYGLSRRRPDIAGTSQFSHMTADLEDESACARALANVEPITQVVYAAVAEAPGLVAGWSDTALMRRNLNMLRNVLEPIANAGALRHVSLMQGTKAYGAHLHPITIPARECSARDPHANFYWLQEDYVREKALSGGWNWTIFRPQIVLGGAIGVAMNPMPVIGVLAALAQEEGEEFPYPGRHLNLQEAVDSRLIARACAWAIGSEAAQDAIFNITNGDIWALKHMWPAIAGMVGLRTASDRPIDLAANLISKQPVWERIVARHGLRESRLDKLLGESHHYLALLLGNSLSAPAPPGLVSTIKLRQAGFGDCFDTQESIRYWLGELVRSRVLPPMGNVSDVLGSSPKRESPC